MARDGEGGEAGDAGATRQAGRAAPVDVGAVFSQVVSGAFDAAVDAEADAEAALGFAFPRLTPAETRGYVAKFRRLFALAQWKRERLAPSFHLDDLSLDPKSWCRYPILSATPPRS